MTQTTRRALIRTGGALALSALLPEVARAAPDATRRYRPDLGAASPELDIYRAGDTARATRRGQG